MKKILTVSIMAVMAVTAANAEIASKAYVDQQDTSALNEAKSYTDTKIGTLPSGSTDVADAIAKAVTGGTEGVVKRSGTEAVGSATVPVYVNASGVVTPTTLGTMATENAADYTKTADLNTTFATDAELTSGLATKQDTITAQAPLSHELVSGLGTMATEDAADYTKTADLNTTFATDAELTSGLATKQDTLTTAQQNAVDSGITSALVTQIGTNQSAIDTLNGDASTTGSVAKAIADANTATTAALANKADKATTLAGYGITDAYTATETDTAITTEVGKLDDDSGAAQAGKWVTAVTQTDGKITATMADPLAAFTKLGADQGDGKYALTATVTGDTITGYKWELIERAQ